MEDVKNVEITNEPCCSDYESSNSEIDIEDFEIKKNSVVSHLFFFLKVMVSCKL